jgi:hypothetical protein
VAWEHPARRLPRRRCDLKRAWPQASHHCLVRRLRRAARRPARLAGRRPTWPASHRPAGLSSAGSTPTRTCTSPPCSTPPGAAGHRGVLHHPGRLPGPGRLAARLGRRAPGRDRGHWQLWRRVTRHLGEAGIEVAEVVRPDRSDRRRRGKNDTIDAENAARAALAGRRTSTPRPKTAWSRHCGCCG